MRAIRMAILLACLGIIAGIMLAVVAGCSVGDGMQWLPGFMRKGDSQVATGANSNVLVMQWTTGGGAGMAVLAALACWRGRNIANRALGRVVEAVEEHDTTKIIRTTIHRRGGGDPAEDLIRRHVRRLPGTPRKPRA